MISICGVQADVSIFEGSLPEYILDKIWQLSLTFPERCVFRSAEDPHLGITYKQLHTSCQSVASFLQQKGFGKGHIACGVIENCWEYVPSFIGVTILGGVYSGVGATFTSFEIEQQLADSECSVVFCGTNTYKRTMEAVNKCPKVEMVIVINNDREFAENYPVGVYSFSTVLQTRPRLTKLPKIDAKTDILMMPYSSGTTGRAKAVCLTHRNFGTALNINAHHHLTEVVSLLESNYAPESNFQLCYLPMYHIYGHGVLFLSLIMGYSIVTMRKFHPQLFCDSIQKHKIQFLNVVPPILNFLAKTPNIDGLTSLRVLVNSASGASPKICEEIKRKFNVIIGQGYGMSEVATMAFLPILSKNPNKQLSSGHLSTYMEAKIVDVYSDEEKFKKDRVGELCLRGPLVMKGYKNRPLANQQTIDADGWLHTGDIAKFGEKNELFIVDRLKELIKVKGHQVSASEIEDILFSHEQIVDAAVVGIEDLKQPGSEQIWAFVVRKSNKLTEQNVHQILDGKVAAYKRLSHVQFVQTIPKSQPGKILRNQLKKIAANTRAKL